VLKIVHISLGALLIGELDGSLALYCRGGRINQAPVAPKHTPEASRGIVLFTR